MNNLTRLTLATAAMLTLIVSSAPAAGFIKFDGIEGEFHSQTVTETEEARFLNGSASGPETCNPYQRFDVEEDSRVQTMELRYDTENTAADDRPTEEVSFYYNKISF